jgi:hypothetical protein
MHAPNVLRREISAKMDSKFATVHKGGQEYLHAPLYSITSSAMEECRAAPGGRVSLRFLG